VEFFVKTTEELIAERSVDHVGSTARYVDIVKDVINVLPVRYISGMLVCSLTISFLNCVAYVLFVGWSSREE
jgi:hypothetical protein